MNGKDEVQKWMKGSMLHLPHGLWGTSATGPSLSSPDPGTGQTGSFSMTEVIYLLNFWIIMPNNYQVLVIWASGSPSLKSSQGPEKLGKIGAEWWREPSI